VSWSEVPGVDSDRAAARIRRLPGTSEIGDPKRRSDVDRLRPLVLIDHASEFARCARLN
jgi:hypothetical protein